MKITAVTKFKQGDIWCLLKKLNWTQSELARRSGLSVGVTASVINMKHRPTKETSEKIQKAFGKAGEFIDIDSMWPENFSGFVNSPKVEQTKDVDVVALQGLERMALHNTMRPDFDEARKFIEMALDRLSDSDRDVVKKYYFEGQTFDEISKKMGVTRSRIGSKIDGAIRKLRKSQLAKPLLKEAKDSICI